MKEPVLAMLEESGAEVTRENYINLAYLADVPDEIDPEIESEFPEEFQTGFHELDKRLNRESD